MSRDPLLTALQSYGERHPAEAQTVEQFAAFVRQYPDCFERSLAIGHVTGSAWVVNAAGSHVLLTHHRKLDRWLQLGGHADGCADVLAVALKEVEEESGLTEVHPITSGIFDVDIHEIPARKSDPAHLHYDVRYLFRADSETAYVVSEESHDLKWIPLEELSDYTTEESMHRMAEKWRSKR